MLFPTIDFGLFFALSLALVWSLNSQNNLKKVALLALSLAFYASWNWRFLLLLLASGVISYLVGLYVDAAAARPFRRFALALGVALDLGILAYFKYLDFFIAQVLTFAHALGLNPSIAFVNVTLPVAISFMTFHAISYIVDVYRGRLAASRSPVDILLYISFFPHLVAGPIVRAHEFLPQLASPQNPGDFSLSENMLLILGGLFKKMVIANYLAVRFVDPVFTDPSQFSRFDLIMAVYAYAIQIYADFSAYTDIAIGVAALLGYRFPENFDQPYRAIGFRDFWRRWHISLSSWLRDYLYIPLGGNTGDWRRYKNLMITMLLGGLWHGAAWNFAIWGGIHGGLLVVEHRFLGEHWTESARLWVKVVGTVITFQLVCLTWIFFRAVDLPHALSFIGGFSRLSAASTLATPFILILISALLAAQFLPTGRMAILERYAIRMPQIAQGAVAGALMIAIFSIGPTGISP